jgi:hypothetical protein
VDSLEIGSSRGVNRLDTYPGSAETDAAVLHEVNAAELTHVQGGFLEFLGRGAAATAAAEAGFILGALGGAALVAGVVVGLVIVLRKQSERSASHGVRRPLVCSTGSPWRGLL